MLTLIPRISAALVFVQPALKHMSTMQRMTSRSTIPRLAARWWVIGRDPSARRKISAATMTGAEQRAVSQIEPSRCSCICPKYGMSGKISEQQKSAVVGDR